MDITYVLSVTVTRAVTPDSDQTIADVAEWMQTAQAKRELERELLRALRVIDGDCDAEVLTVGQEKP